MCRHWKLLPAFGLIYSVVQGKCECRIPPFLSKSINVLLLAAALRWEVKTHLFLSEKEKTQVKWPDVNPCNPAVVVSRWTASKSQSSSCIKWAKSQTTKVAVKSRPNIAVKDKYLGSVSQSANVCISILVRKSPEALWEFFFLICQHLPSCWYRHRSHQAGGSSSPGSPTSCSLRQITTSLMHRQAEQSAAGEEQKGTRDKLVCLPQNSVSKAPSLLVSSSKCSWLLSGLYRLRSAHTKLWCLSSSCWDPQPRDTFDICEAWSLGSHEPSTGRLEMLF